MNIVLRSQSIQLSKAVTPLPLIPCHLQFLEKSEITALGVEFIGY